MKRYSIITVLSGILLSSCLYAEQVIVLDGQHLSLENAWAIAAENKKVSIDPAAMGRVKKSHQLLALIRSQILTIQYIMAKMLPVLFVTASIKNQNFIATTAICLNSQI